MRLRRHRRNVVVWRSSVHSSGGYGDLHYKRAVSAGRIRRCIRIGVLITIIGVRPRWRPLLGGLALTVLGVIERDSPIGVVLIFGLLLLWQSLLIPACPDADRERRSQLERELATFTTPAQRRDLEATLDRYPDGVTCEIRGILASRAVTAPGTGVPGAGRH
jgi:hypothetical protein